MRKFYFLMAALAVFSCSGKYGKGGDNAAQFVREQVPGLRADIERIEVVGVDTLLSDVGLMFASNRASSAKMAFYAGRLSYDEVDFVLDSCAAELLHVNNSWRYGVTPKGDGKYASQLRIVYTIRVTMKSGQVKEPRVLMEADGVTPRMLERDFETELLNYQSMFHL